MSARKTPRTRKTPRLHPGNGEDTRTALLVAALDAFAESGYQAMSVRELARALGVSHNIVHHHFGSKQNLWRAALEHGLAGPALELLQFQGDATGAADPVEVVRTIVRNAVMLYARFPSIARIIAIESAQGGERLDFLYERYINPTIRSFGRFLDSAHEQGVRELDTRTIMLFIVAGVPALFTHSALAGKLGGLHADSTASVTRYANTIAEMVIGGLMGSVQHSPAPAARAAQRGKSRRAATRSQV
jgi:TetR/AcrR family transcriptional regulator